MSGARDTRRVCRVSDADFTDIVLGSSVPILVDFHADWCAPCRRVGPILDDLAAELTWMSFTRLDVDTSPVTAAAYQVTGLPTMLIFAAGEPVLSIVGARPKQVIHDLLVGLPNVQRG